MTQGEFEDLLTGLDALVAEFEEHPDRAIGARVLELIRHVDAVHREGLGRLVSAIGGTDPAILENAARDPIVRILLALYDLEPGGPPEAGFIPLSALQASALAARSRRERRP
jgi:hypothetical protein